MKFSAAFVTLSLLFIGVHAHDLPSRYALQRRGSQFVTGPCTQDSDCQQGCCAFTTGKCAGPAVAQTNGDGGCGFGNASPNCNVAAALGLNECVAGASKPDTTSAAVQSAAAFVAKLDGLSFTPSTGGSANNAGAGGAAAKTTPAAASTSTSSASQSSKLFVTATCKSDSQCQQGCCAFATGKCAGPDVAQTNGDRGCGFGNAQPNCDVAAALGLNACVAGAAKPDTTSAEVQAAAAFVAQLDNLPFTPSTGGSANNAGAGGAAAGTTSTPKAAAKTTAAAASKGTSSASQSSKLFVTATCTSDSQCQQGCCAFATGKCAGPDVAQTNGDRGCGFGNAQPNCDVAAALGLNACVAGAAKPDTTSAEVQAAAAFVAQLDNLPFTPARR